MAFASVDDVKNRLGGGAFTSDQTAQATLLLDAAQSIVAEAADKDDDWAAALSPVPKVLKFVTVEVVCRAMANPEGVAGFQESLGAYSYSRRFRSEAEGAGLLLTKTEELLVRRVVYGRTSGSAYVEGTVDEVHDLLYGS